MIWNHIYNVLVVTNISYSHDSSLRKIYICTNVLQPTDSLWELEQFQNGINFNQSCSFVINVISLKQIHCWLFALLPLKILIGAWYVFFCNLTMTTFTTFGHDCTFVDSLCFSVSPTLQRYGSGLRLTTAGRGRI